MFRPGEFPFSLSLTLYPVGFLLKQTLDLIALSCAIPAERALLFPKTVPKKASGLGHIEWDLDGVPVPDLATTAKE